MVMAVHSPAKINLGLWVLSKRKDGYHNIITILDKVTLCDEILIKEGPFTVKTNLNIPESENLVFKALVEFSKMAKIKLNYSVFIKKNIPPGSGLGGGSSNLATVLQKINELSGNPLGKADLKSIAGSLSSDAPFFLMNGPALAKGRGEMLKSIKLPPLTYTIVIPRVRSSTKLIYSMVNQQHYTRITEREVEEIVQNREFHKLKNVLGEIAAQQHPEIREVLEFLERRGYKPLVSGTGSAVFYIGDPDPEVEAGARARGWKVINVKSWLGV
jgi:4-diphosphocytidyl-2-C-methyl-D-erythritol kinase